MGRDGDGRRLDLPGAVLVTAGLATLAYGISQTEGWTADATAVPLLVGLALIRGVPRRRGAYVRSADAARAVPRSRRGWCARWGHAIWRPGDGRGGRRVRLAVDD